ncbi:MAG: hypothetical protein NTY01_24050, partial [Verrucomicrobia bacterium]|nr:hypothetical protein [Verrucomicrobiota bacterium]
MKTKSTRRNPVADASCETVAALTQTPAASRVEVAAANNMKTTNTQTLETNTKHTDDLKQEVHTPDFEDQQSKAAVNDNGSQESEPSSLKPPKMNNMNSSEIYEGQIWLRSGYSGTFDALVVVGLDGNYVECATLKTRIKSRIRRDRLQSDSGKFIQLGDLQDVSPTYWEASKYLGDSHIRSLERTLNKYANSVTRNSVPPLWDYELRCETIQDLVIMALTRKAHSKDKGPTADQLLTPELIERYGFKGLQSLAHRVPKYNNSSWALKTIGGDALIDIVDTDEESEDLCEVLLRLTQFDIRLGSRTPHLALLAQRLHKRFPDPENGAQARISFGLGFETFDEEVAHAMDPYIPSPVIRMMALYLLHIEGFRTFVMLCPILPEADKQAYKRFAEQAMKVVYAERCELVCARPVNCRS